MYIASTENYTGAYEVESIDELVKKSAHQLTEVFQLVDDVEVYISAHQLNEINGAIQDNQDMIALNIRDTEFYNQETARLIYD